MALAIAIVLSSIILGYYLYAGLTNVGVGLDHLAKALNNYLKIK